MVNSLLSSKNTGVSEIKVNFQCHPQQHYDCVTIICIDNFELLIYYFFQNFYVLKISCGEPSSDNTSR